MKRILKRIYVAKHIPTEWYILLIQFIVPSVQFWSATKKVQYESPQHQHLETYYSCHSVLCSVRRRTRDRRKCNMVNIIKAIKQC